MKLRQKAYFVLLSLLIGSFHLQSQALATGDIMFVGFNADGDDDFAIVVLRDITDDTIYFTDKPLDGAGNLVSSSEGFLRWETGTTTISAGCIISFTDIDNSNNTSFGSSVGTLTREGGNFTLAAGGDGIVAFTGTSNANPTNYLAAIENETGAFGNITGSGLDVCTALTITNGSNDDGSAYTGPRNTESSFSDYKDSLKVLAKWDTETSNGENVLPFSAEKFSLSGPMCTTANITGRDTTICSGEPVDLKTLISGTFSGSLNYGTAFGSYPDTITTIVSPTSMLTYFIQDSVAGTSCVDTAMVTVNIMDCTPPCDIEIAFASTQCNADGTYDLKVTVDSTNSLGDMVVAIIDNVTIDTLAYPSADGGEICIETGLEGDGTMGVQLILADSTLSSTMVWVEDFETDGKRVCLL